jgi:hypothetical protein
MVYSCIEFTSPKVRIKDLAHYTFVVCSTDCIGTNLGTNTDINAIFKTGDFFLWQAMTLYSCKILKME